MDNNQCIHNGIRPKGRGCENNQKTDDKRSSSSRSTRRGKRAGRGKLQKVPLPVESCLQDPWVCESDRTLPNQPCERLVGDEWLTQPGDEEENSTSPETRASEDLESKGGSSHPPAPAWVYPSCQGLAGKRITPLFRAPISLVANGYTRWYDDRHRCVKSKGRQYVTINLRTDDRGILLAERIISSANNDKDDDNQPTRRAKEFFKNLRILDFQRAVWDALCMGLQAVKALTNTHGPLRSSQCRYINRFKSMIVLKPVEAAKELKRWAGIARSHYFGDKTVPLPSLFNGWSGYSLLVFSYVGRSLPPPPKDDSLLGEFISRIGDDPAPEHPDWRMFCRAFFAQNMPVRSTSYRTDPSVSASLCYNRSLAGGFTGAVQGLVSFGMSILLVGGRDDLKAPFSLDNLATRAFDSEFYGGNLVSGLTPLLQKPIALELSRQSYFPRNLEILCRFVKNESLYTVCLRIAVHVVLETIDFLPIQPLYAEEKGMKVRYPSLSMAAATLVYQLFRRAIDAHLVRDRKHASAMGKSHAFTRWTRPPQPTDICYSGDASFATDLHPFWLTRQAYEELLPHHPELQQWSRYFDKLFGPHKIVTDLPEKLQIPPVDELHAADPRFVYRLIDASSPFGETFSVMGQLETGDWYATKGDDILFAAAGRTFSTWDPKNVAQATNTVANFADFIVALNSEPQRLTRRSASMGDATSFPIMPLLTAFACHKAQPPIIHFETTGDDVIGIGSHAQWDEYERVFSQCGGVLSVGDPGKGKPCKIFRHPRKLLFCEEAYKRRQNNNGRWHIKQAITFPLSLFVAPPGGSKGTISWYNQPTSVRNHLDANLVSARNVRPLWRKSKTYSECHVAYNLGLPVGADTEWGGIAHPFFPRRPKTHGRNQQWLQVISQLPVLDLCLGTGLCPLPSGQSQLTRKLAKAEIDRLVNGRKPCVSRNPSGPLLADVMDQFCRMTSSWEAYHRRAPEENRAPRIGAVARKFEGILKRRKPMGKTAFTYEGTMSDVSDKRSLFVDLGEVQLYSSTPRSYGLMAATTRRDTAKHFEHLSDFRIDRAYIQVGQKIAR